MNTPRLETERLILRPFKEGDATRVFECWEIGYNLGKNTGEKVIQLRRWQELLSSQESN